MRDKNSEKPVGTSSHPNTVPSEHNCRVLLGHQPTRHTGEKVNSITGSSVFVAKEL
jgi:hypothetical protein